MRSQVLRHFDALPLTVRNRAGPSTAFSTTSHASKKAMPPRPTLSDSELHHVYLKGSGPGGQKINKTNSACQLTHIPTGIVVKSQATRSRSQNHNIARRILAEKIELLEKGKQSRAAIVAATASKKKASKRKKALRKYRKLDERKEAVEDHLENGGRERNAEDAPKVLDESTHIEHPISAVKSRPESTAP